MEQTAQIAAALYERVAGIPGIAQVEFSSHFARDDLQRLSRTPLLLLSPPMVQAAAGRQRLDGGRQVLLDTYLIDRRRRRAGDSPGFLDVLQILDALDAALVNETLGLALEPITVQRREPLSVAQSGDSFLSVVRTVYRTVIFSRLAQSRFVYTDRNGREAAIDFELVAGLGQMEGIRDDNDYARSLSGELRYYRRQGKKQARVEFHLIPTVLKDKLLDMKQTGASIVYYRDREAGPTMTCGWVNDFDFFEERPGFWSGSVILQEV